MAKKKKKSPTSRAPKRTVAEKPVKPGALEYPCVEGGIWTPVPDPPRPAGALAMKFKDVDEKECGLVKAAQCLTFHTVGCSGCFDSPEPGRRTARAMTAQATNPAAFGGYDQARPASFLFHLGDVVYKQAPESTKDGTVPPSGKDQAALYAKQFYDQYASYEREIFAIAGNHDSKFNIKPARSAIGHYRQNFCAPKRKLSADNTHEKKRLAMNQPYLYWRLQTPVAHIIGLHTNDVNGGLLDDPMSNEEPQFQWLLDTLSSLAAAPDGRAVILALHYPPYSGAANFSQRGDPSLAPTPMRNPAEGLLQPISIPLQHAFRRSGIFPDLVISAHAHLYQRITYTYTGGRQIPYLIVGSGGHAEIRDGHAELEQIAKGCDGKLGKKPTAPFPVVLPRRVILPPGDKAEVEHFNDTDFGYARITVNARNSEIAGEFFVVPQKGNARCADRFTLDLRTHRLL